MKQKSNRSNSSRQSPFMKSFVTTDTDDSSKRFIEIKFNKTGFKFDAAPKSLFNQTFLSKKTQNNIWKPDRSQSTNTRSLYRESIKDTSSSTISYETMTLLSYQHPSMHHLQDLLDKPQQEIFDSHKEQHINFKKIAPQIERYRPSSPKYYALHPGHAVSLQIEKNEFFDFQLEVEPILQVIVGKTILQSQIELYQEDEQRQFDLHAKRYRLLRQHQLHIIERLQNNLDRRDDEIDRRQDQTEWSLYFRAFRDQKSIVRDISINLLRNKKKTYLNDLEQRGLFGNIYQNQILRNYYIPWLMNEVQSILSDQVQLNLLIQQTSELVLFRQTEIFVNEKMKHEYELQERIKYNDYIKKKIIIRRKLKKEEAQMIKLRNFRMEKFMKITEIQKPDDILQKTIVTYDLSKFNFVRSVDQFSNYTYYLNILKRVTFYIQFNLFTYIVKQNITNFMSFTRSNNKYYSQFKLNRIECHTSIYNKINLIQLVFTFGGILIEIWQFLTCLNDLYVKKMNYLNKQKADYTEKQFELTQAQVNIFISSILTDRTGKPIILEIQEKYKKQIEEWLKKKTSFLDYQKQLFITKCSRQLDLFVWDQNIQFIIDQKLLNMTIFQQIQYSFLTFILYNPKNKQEENKDDNSDNEDDKKKNVQQHQIQICEEGHEEDEFDNGEYEQEKLEIHDDHPDAQDTNYNSDYMMKYAQSKIKYNFVKKKKITMDEYQFAIWVRCPLDYNVEIADQQEIQEYKRSLKSEDYFVQFDGQDFNKQKTLWKAIREIEQVHRSFNPLFLKINKICLIDQNNSTFIMKAFYNLMISKQEEFRVLNFETFRKFCMDITNPIYERFVSQLIKDYKKCPVYDFIEK